MNQLESRVHPVNLGGRAVIFQIPVENGKDDSLSVAHLNRARICKRLRSSGIDSSAYVPCLRPCPIR
jgi:hypothetical protein